jgi:hypothetical protein
MDTYVIDRRLEDLESDSPVLDAPAPALAGFPETDVNPDASHLATMDPDWYVYREIGYGFDSNGIQFRFESPFPPQLRGTKSIEDIVDELRNAGLLARTLLQVKSFYRRTVASLVRVHHHLTGRPETPLDLNITTPRYVILRLHRGWKWRFSPTAKAVSHKPHPTDNYTPFYGGLRHVPKSTGTPSPDELADCDMIYFISNPPADITNFRHSFNFRVQLEQAPRVENQGTPQEVKIPRLLDIVLDPDIRNPDGTPS